MAERYQMRQATDHVIEVDHGRSLRPADSPGKPEDGQEVYRPV